MISLIRLALKSFVILLFSWTWSSAENIDYSAMTTEKLIDELARIDKPAPGVAGLGIYDAFIAEDRPPGFSGGVLGVPIPDVPPQMRELVRRGTKALPFLIEHLSDARSTQLVVGEDGPNFFFMFRLYGSEYDPRGRDQKKQRHLPLKFPRMDQRFTGAYSVKVADICYVLIGQIVNRRLTAVRYQPTGGLIVNSPIQSPILAEKTKRDWQHLDVRAHEVSLLSDVRADNEFRSKAGITRLRYYYPDCYSVLRGVDLAKRQEFEADEFGYEQQANEYSRQGQYNKAVEEWTKWIKHAPNSATGYRRRGNEYANGGQLSKAIEDYNQSIKLEENENIIDILLDKRANVYEILGFHVGAKTDRRAAIAIYKQIVRKNPNNASEYVRLGNRYQSDSQYFLAIKQYNKAIKMYPKGAFAYARRATSYQKLGNFRAALADYQKILELDPLNRASALEERAKMFMAMGRLQEALADITVATTPHPQFPSHPPHPPYFDTRAHIHLAMNKPQEAIADFTRAIDAGVGQPSTYFGRGNAYERIGSLTLAIADYRKCLTEPAGNSAQIEIRRKARIRLKKIAS